VTLAARRKLAQWRCYVEDRSSYVVTFHNGGRYVFYVMYAPVALEDIMAADLGRAPPPSEVGPFTYARRRPTPTRARDPR
jgi:hypothetical protein